MPVTSELDAGLAVKYEQDENSSQVGFVCLYRTGNGRTGNRFRGGP